MNKYKLSIKGKNPDYFLKKVISRKVNLYDVNKSNRELIIIVDKDGFDKICKIKTSYDISIISVSGILKIKEVIHKYFFFILFFCVGVLLNIFFSKLILDVEVVHSNKNIKEIIYKDLKSLGISKFKFKVSFLEKEKIVMEILNRERDNIEWLEIEEIGTKYLVKVEQRKLNKKESVCSNRNIVAKRNARIIEISADSGEVTKKINDYVLKNDVIISGVIHNKEDIVSEKCAVGRVFGEVWYQVEVELPTSVTSLKKTGNSKYRFNYIFLKKNLVFLGGYSDFYSYNIIESSNKLLPISFNFSKLYEVNKITKKYTLDNSSDEAIKIAMEKLKLKLGKDDVILSKKVLKKEINNSKIMVDVFFKVKEDITEYKNIELTDLSGEG